MPADPPERAIGRFAVSATQAEIARFRRVLPGVPDPQGALPALPAGFPVVWLGRDEVRTALHAALATLSGGGDLAPVHLSQDIAYAQPLVADAPYWFDVGLSDPDERGVVCLTAVVRDQALVTKARLSGRLALVPVAAKT